MNKLFYFIFLLEVCLFSAEEPRKQHLIENIPRQTLGRRRHLMSSFARSETANLVSVTSGTERKRV